MLNDKLEGNFQEFSDINAFWFAYYAMTHPFYLEKTRDYFFNAPDAFCEKVMMYCQMWHKYRWN